jgi:hypothetical protein
MVPLKYGPPNDGSSPVINLMVGGSFLMLLIALYRSKNGKPGKPGSKGSSKGGFGGGGGMNEMMGMSKSGA